MSGDIRPNITYICKTLVSKRYGTLLHPNSTLVPPDQYLNTGNEMKLREFNLKLHLLEILLRQGEKYIFTLKASRYKQKMTDTKLP